MKVSAEDAATCRGWKGLARVTIAVLYSYGIDSATRVKLDTVRGNVSRFSLAAHKFPEFRMGSVLDDAQLIIIGVARRDPVREGTIELIDGVHRVVPMAAKGSPTVQAYLAELR